MPHRFTRQQLLASLLNEVTQAQASFQACQLAAWCELAPESAQPSHEQLGKLSRVELELNIKPYRPRWYVRWYHYLMEDDSIVKPPVEQEYVFTSSSDPECIRLKLLINNSEGNYAQEGDEALEPTEAKT